jgi:hypothetical protein
VTVSPIYEAVSVLGGLHVGTLHGVNLKNVYLFPIGQNEDDSTEANREMVLSTDGTLRNLTVILIAEGLALADTDQFIVRKNRADTTLTITITDGDAAGTQYTSSNEIAVTAGDCISINMRHNDANPGGITLSFSWSLEYITPRP